VPAPVQERGTRIPAAGNIHPALIERQFSLLPAGTRLVARLQTPVSTAVKAPVVAAIEYNYDRDGDTVIPAGPNASGELDQANDRGSTAFRCRLARLKQSTAARWAKLPAARGQSIGPNTGKKFLVRSLTGVGTILAATMGVQGGLGVNETVSNNVLLRERLANNIALAGEQQMNELAYRQNIVVTVPGNTRFYIMLARPGDRATGPTPGGSVPSSNPNAPSYTAAAPSIQELRELLELKRELTQTVPAAIQNTDCDGPAIEKMKRQRAMRVAAAKEPEGATGNLRPSAREPVFCDQPRAEACVMFRTAGLELTGFTELFGWG
jgi:hypothetical protein